MVWACEEKRGCFCRKKGAGNRITREKESGKTKEKVHRCSQRNERSWSYSRRGA